MTNDSYPAIFLPLLSGSFSMHSAEQNVASPDLSFSARSAGTHVPHLSQRTNLLDEGVVADLVALTSVAEVRDSVTFLMSLR